MHTKSATVTGILSSQKILHPDDPTANIAPAINEIRETLKTILKRNTIAEARIPLTLKPATHNKGAWVPQSSTITAKLNFRGIYQPLVMRKDRFAIGRASNLSLNFDFSVHDLAGRTYAE
ncbi:MAG: hypothetical protein ACOYN2_03550 [Patescibacteria group bacterium]